MASCTEQVVFCEKKVDLSWFYFVYVGADVCKEGAPLGIFRYPSYVQDIMGYVLCHQLV